MLNLLSVLAVLLGGLFGPQPLTPGQPKTCRPSAQHPYPVVLVHGTGGSAVTNWLTMRPALERAGYCVFALDYGDTGLLPLPVYGLGPVEESAQELSDYVDWVLSVTGASKVALVGHSQGGMMPRYYLRFLGGAAKVADLVGLAPSNHGTTNPLTSVAGLLCPACQDQLTGSAFLTKLNDGREVEEGVDYTMIATEYDEVVVPYTSSFLNGGENSAHVTNTTVQRSCGSLYLVEHAAIAFDPVAIQWTMEALRSDGPASPAFQPSCAALLDEVVLGG